MTGILLENNGNLLQPVIVKGQLQVGDMLRQNQALILNLHQGELKEKPLTGVGLSEVLLDHDPLWWRTKIKEQLEMDGQTVDYVRIKNNSIEIEAEY